MTEQLAKDIISLHDGDFEKGNTYHTAIELPASNFVRIYVNIRKLVPMDARYKEITSIVLIIIAGYVITCTKESELIYFSEVPVLPIN